MERGEAAGDASSPRATTPDAMRDDSSPGGV